MAITMNTLCFECQLRKKLKLARELGTDEQATVFGREMMQMLTQAPEGMDSTQFGALAEELLRKHFPVGPDRLKEEKELSNRFVLERYDAIREKVEAAADPLFLALQYAIQGNYIDFSALQGEVSFEQLEQLLFEAPNLQLDRAAYEAFLADVAKARKFLYLTDNAGEIVLDRLFAEQLQKSYPDLEILFCVRGAPAFNDALREDAEAIGLPFPVIDNGTNVGGTPIARLGAEAKQALDDADVIFAKGMGNVESMYGCGYNVYYAFLVKCDRLIQVFQKEKLTPMLLRERTVCADNAAHGVG